MYRRRGTVRSSRKGTFNPDDDKHVKYTKLGVWDLYEEKHPKLGKIPWSEKFNVERYLELYGSLPYIWRMLKDVGSIRACWSLLGLYLLVELASCVLPAVSLWYSGQLLTIVQTAVDERKIDKELLFRVAIARVLCSTATRFLSHFQLNISRHLNSYIKQHYSIYMFRTMARLDVPTFDDPMVQRQLEQTSNSGSLNSLVWQTITASVHIVTTGIFLLSQLSVLFNVLKDQRDGPLLAITSFAHTAFSWSTSEEWLFAGVWAATTKDEDYIKMEGLKRMAGDGAHRKEIVAGGMWDYLLSEYTRCINSLGSNAQDFFAIASTAKHRTFPSLISLIGDHLKELPQIVFTLRAVQYPASIPVSLVSLHLVTQATATFSQTLFRLFSQTASIADQWATVRKLYDVMEIPNRVEDGMVPFPENQQSLELGIEIEFRNVSFKYPGSDVNALQNISFKIEKGQLCVIVGKNGSGKSTILKLIARLYDPTEGQILIDGKDIKALKLADLRRATTVLFQDYTHFPLSIRENIALGDPGRADEDRVTQAAILGGASEFIERLPDGYDTYVERPVRDYYSGLPEGTTNLFGRSVNYGRVRGMGGMKASQSTSLSGGQMQRIALSRTFMRSIVSESSVGLLLFDEPSASLDPTAEHDLFERLRRLRGQKTMIFSSHRFGNLTRHADLILYMNDSVIIEEGTHSNLIQKGGEYARIWNLQAQTFLS